MSDRANACQALAAACAGPISILGLVHEVAGPLLFPWAPPMFGALLWHGIGMLAIVVGLLLVAGIVGTLAVPVVPLALFASAGGIAAMSVMALAKGEFHFLAMCLVFLGLGVATFHRKAQRLRR